MSRWKRTAILALAVAAVAAFSLLPFLWFLVTSFKTPLEVTAIPPLIIPSGSFGFYRSAFGRYDLLLYVRNSVVVAGCTTLVTMSVSVFAAYALARLRIRRRGLILGGLLIISMFPQISIAGPIWSILQKIGWLNTVQGLVMPYVTLNLPLAVWVLTNFFGELPKEIEEAARIDGCSHAQILFRIVLPLAAPGVFTAAILIFIYAWNEFFFALLIMTRHRLQTLPVGIALFQGQYTMPWGEIAAASIVATLPLVLVVFLFQKRIVRGLSAGALKG
ncbi:MAG: carbohydrate ABC transporter permease [Spirochaetes bacterium]|nr:carbohydrate ABC transporter permease [Spirochaetota bacterium]